MTLGWTEIIVAFFTLLGCCAWFVEGRKHRPTANGLKADNRLKDMELARLYVQQFEETIGNPLRKQVGDLLSQIASTGCTSAIDASIIALGLHRTCLRRSLF